MQPSGRELKAVVAEVLVLVGVLTFGLPGVAAAFKLRPEITDNEGKIRRLQESMPDRLYDQSVEFVVKHFSSPVHEDITQRIFGCTLPGLDCGNAGNRRIYAPDGVIAGVRWNDNPPFSLDTDTKAKFSACQHDFTAFKLPNFSRCWIELFKDAQKNAGRQHYRARPTGTQYSLIYRVHFGDMQFLHSMASWDGERAADTKSRILMWAEFAYNFAKGEISHNKELRKTDIAGMEKVFQNTNWTAERLFTMDDTTFRTPELMRQIALGSLLHLIQDSFSRAHVSREPSTGATCEAVPGKSKPGRVEMFYAFNSQDSSRHGDKDSKDGLEVHMRSVTPNIVTIGHEVLNYLKSGKAWREVRKYLDCLYELVDEDAPSEAGIDYQKSR